MPLRSLPVNAAAYLPPGEWWGHPEIATFLGVSQSTVRDYATDPKRKFPEGKRVGGRFLYLADDVRAWHEARPGQGTRTDLRDQPDRSVPEQGDQQA